MDSTWRSKKAFEQCADHEQGFRDAARQCKCLNVKALCAKSHCCSKVVDASQEQRVSRDLSVSVRLLANNGRTCNAQSM